MKIYTKKGDRGETSLWSGRRVQKGHGRVSAVGDLDELSAFIGHARLLCPGHNDLLREVQKRLYLISAELSSEGRHQPAQGELDTGPLEEEIDALTNALPPLKDFIYPGDSEASCRLHIARAVARRAERSLSAIADPSPSDEEFAYLNRLSDFLFVLAREADHGSDQSDALLKG